MVAQNGSEVFGNTAASLMSSVSPELSASLLEPHAAAVNAIAAAVRTAVVRRGARLYFTGFSLEG
jgi:hypothetical protein